MRLEKLLCFLPVLPLVSAATIAGRIAFNEVLLADALLPTSQVFLDHGSRKVWIKPDGSFEINGVKEGAHHLEAVVPGYVFHPLLVTISPPSPLDDSVDEPLSNRTVHVQLFNLARQSLPLSSSSLPYPLVLEPLARENYYTPKGGMNMLGLLRSPMVLMMLFTGLMMFALPKLIANMDSIDPELSKEMAETRQKMQGFQNGDWTGALSTMLASGTPDTPPIQKPGSTANGGTSGRTGGKKRRK
ncbi:uncharacterized protein L203_105691 [Cryptococcus depauperatus CBS 7841]|uniref:Uncharacterized protein n=1 Tax=Cryptococcus depauperatus CBS 7841 TaxID=1295531 RepID=A0A1E3IF97_9TREE|nr:hypothetical protein L203_03566 [Cryptococcus depauperatus CBS 7841]